VSFDIHPIGVILFSTVSVLSLLLIVAKPLAREFEATALTWIRVFKRIRAEWRKPLTIDQPSQPRPPIDQRGSKNELG